MKSKLFSILLTLALCMSCAPTPQSADSLEYIMDMVHRNPGEPLQLSKYYNEKYVKEVGYNSIVSQIYVQCALTYDDFDKGVIPEGSKEREWIMLQRKEVADKIKRAKDAGLDIYTFTDMLVLPTMLIEKYKDQLVSSEDQTAKSAIRGKLAPNIEYDLTVTLIKAQIKEIFETFPDLDGLVIRCGETYLYDTPYHSGSNPVRVGGEESIAGNVKLINLLRDEVCVKYNKKLFFRSWGLPMSVSPEIYTAITDQIELHDNLLFAIKYTKGDFHRLKLFNPTIGTGKHPYIIEFQAQPEYYGKGAHPAYMFGSVLNGFSEYKRLMDPSEVQSMMEIKDDPKFKGLWSWSRGGGWKGPFINNELWCDINAQSMVVWAQDRSLNEDQVLEVVFKRLGVEESSFDDFKKLLKLSDEAILKGQYTDLGMKFNEWWARDQFFAATSSQPMFEEAINTNRVDELISEKNYAVELWDQIVELAYKIKISDPFYEDYIKVSSEYGRYKYDVIRQIFILGVNSKQYELSGKLNVEQTRAAIEAYDRLWIEWQELEDNNPICASIYEPYGFSISLENGAQGAPERGVKVTVDQLREIVK
ncbi:MAG: hypothetical protein SNG02_03995 [Rikenellaceae bacterium]